MSEALQALLDSGALYLAIGALLCVAVGLVAVRKMFRRARRAEPPDRR